MPPHPDRVRQNYDSPQTWRGKCDGCTAQVIVTKQKFPLDFDPPCPVCGSFLWVDYAAC